jgi:5-methylcytosine-specific restriction endonuclease McrA
MDTDTIISDITDNNSIDSQKQDELRIKTDQNLNNLTNDQRRDKCNEMGLKHAGKMKKPELVQALLSEFMKLVVDVKDKKVNDLKAICKHYNVKFGVGTKKEELYWLILNHCSENLIFKLDESELKAAEAKVVEAKVVEAKVVEAKIPEPKVAEPKLSLLDQLEKQRQEIEVKMQEELKKQEEEIKRQEEEVRREKEEAARREKEEAKKKKQSIPKNVRVIVWNHYIGENIIHHRCLCCKKVLISNTNYEVGHVLSEKNGGTHEINNLRPICFACNHSMGTENMIDFVVKYGLYIG